MSREKHLGVRKLCCESNMGPPPKLVEVSQSPNSVVEILALRTLDGEVLLVVDDVRTNQTFHDA
jgi:hypothetical protein